ncbi:L7Ae/L30e/S12e/Gadd45 family ribosomal protein [Corticicoccus populi]|uniref:L7Ae/L30e/S12e/Gadd45 family ribosomal protein n=1 Tax=Corticicoccus populi TaxID=1812821 RepID=A0ABW5WUL2_9STAP
MTDPLLNLLGLIKRAGKMQNGEEKTLDAIKRQQASVIFLASDAGTSTTKKIKDKSKFYKVQVIDQYTKEELSSATGAGNRVVLAVVDKGFGKKCLELAGKGK